MESILVLTHADESGAALTKASLEAVSAGAELAAGLNATVTLGIVAATASVSTKGLPAYRVLLAANEAFAQARYASDAAACEALCRAAGATIVLAPSTARFARVAAGVAHRLSGVIDTHITSLRNADGPAVTRW